MGVAAIASSLYSIPFFICIATARQVHQAPFCSAKFVIHLFVGTSFWQSLLRAMGRSHSFKKTDSVNFVQIMRVGVLFMKLVSQVFACEILKCLDNLYPVTHAMELKV